ncbi:MAG: lamin tail domain-containing protein, partial [Candidatus Parcubacteria bacterium]|nr:lamin tail domain-containing protein [Candidatus Parcubacteria bacterium]
MAKILKIIFNFLFLFAFISSVQAVANLDVVISEIAWMGTAASYNDEWLELYNNTDEVINLEGWSLKDSDGTINISLVGRIPAKGFFLLERTDDNTLPELSADQIYKGALGNAGENLELTDSLGNIIDSVNSASGWFSGDNLTKQT